ncbi:MAG: hypothetical protein ACXVCP_17645 [Bdellovibrio sp.]
MKMLKLIYLLAIMLFSGSCLAANHYVRQGANGNGSGSDWTNACTDFTGACADGSLVRGDTYYVADGSYGALIFYQAASGNLVITIKKATVADHGTAMGWSDSYGISQAIFAGSINFFTSNWIFDGVTGVDYSPGHGFKVDNSAGGDTTLVVFGMPGGVGASNITVSHIDLIGAGYNQTTVNDRGFYSASSNASNFTISHNYISGVGVPFVSRQVKTMLVEYNYVEGNHSQPESHGEPWSDTGSDYITFRYNRMKNPEGTAVFFIGNGGGPIADDNTSTGWQIYGNIFYYQNYVVGAGHNGGTAAILWCPSAVYGGDTYCDKWLIYNNTFYDFSYGSSSARILGSGGAGITNPIVQNNIWDSCADNAYHDAITASYNYYRNTAHSTEPNEQIGTVTPFIDALNANFALAAPTVSGITLSSPFNVDMKSNIRGADQVWDRGALEFGGMKPAPLAAPMNLRVVVK